MDSNLYVHDIRISKEIPRSNYLSRLPVVRNLKNMEKELGGSSSAGYCMRGDLCELVLYPGSADG